VLGRSEGTRFSSRSDDEVGGTNARSGPAMFAPPICRRGRRNAARTELILRHNRFVGADEDGGSPANIAASAASHQTQRAQRAEQSDIARRRAEPGWRAPVWTSRASRHAFRLRASEEGSGFQLYSGTNGGKTVRIAEHQFVRDGHLGYSEVVVDGAAFMAFMAG
jgi:hypothetical protein